MATNSEEILIKLGVDGSSLSRGMRGVKDFMSEAGENIGKVFTSKLGAALSVAAVGVFLDKMGEFAKATREAAEVAGVSSEYIQLWGRRASKAGIDSEAAEKGLNKFVVKIGQAREGIPEAVEAFQKYGLSLRDASGHAATTEEMIAKFADLLNQTDDAAKRAALSVEFFGKSGAKIGNMLSSGSAGIKSFNDKNSVYAYNDRELGAFEGVKAFGSGTGKASTLLARLAGEALTMFSPVTTMLGKNAQDNRWFAEMRRRFAGGGEAEEGEQGGPSEEEMHARTSALERLHRIEREERMSGLSHEGKLKELVKERVAATEKLHQMESGSSSYINQEIELAELSKQIHLEIVEIEKGRIEKKKEADKKSEESLKAQKVLDKEIGEAREKVAYETTRRSQATMEGVMPTLEELANSGTWTHHRRNGRNTFTPGPFAQDAADILGLQQDAHDSLMFGDTARASADVSEMNRRKKLLSDAGVQLPDQHLESMDESLKLAQAHLADIVGKGVTIKGGQQP